MRSAERRRIKLRGGVRRVRLRRLITRGEGKERKLTKLPSFLPSRTMLVNAPRLRNHHTRRRNRKIRKDETHLKDEFACRSSSVRLPSCVGVAGFDDFFFKADFNGTALNFGSLAGISSTRDVSML